MAEREQREAIQQLLSTDAKTHEVGAGAIYNLTYHNPPARVSLAQDVRVIPRLVELLGQGSDNCSSCSHYSLFHLARVGPAVELQIANALDHAALTWLDAFRSKQLLEILVKNPQAEALLAGKRGKAHVVALLEAASKSANANHRDAVNDMLRSVANGTTWLGAGGMSREEAEDMLGTLHSQKQLPDQIYVDDVRQALLRSLDERLKTPIKECIRSAQDDSQDRDIAMKRRLAVLWLANAIQADPKKRQEITAGGGVAALVAELQREVLRTDTMSDDQRRSSVEVKRQIVSALAALPSGVETRALGFGSACIEAIVALVHTSEDSDAELAVQALEKMMVDSDIRDALCDAGGVPFLIRHLRYGIRDEMKRATLSLLERRYLVRGSCDSFILDNVLSIFHDGKGPAALCHLCLTIVDPELRSTAKRILQDCTELIPRLLQSSDADSLCALEVMSRVPTNCDVIVECNGVSSLAELAKRAQSAVRAPAIRVLANLCHGNDGNCRLIAATGVSSILVAALMLTGTAFDDLTEAAAMALRNLVNDPPSQARIGSSGVIPHVIGLVQAALSPRLREIAAGLLGNLARQNHHANQQMIASCNGVTALVEFARAATNARQRQTATMALWVLVKENEKCRKQFLAADGVNVVAHIEQLNETTSQPWARRVLSVTRPNVHTRS